MQTTDVAAFAAALPPARALLGLDLGTKLIGLAASDDLRLIASACGTVRRTARTADIAALCALAAKRSAGGVVLGYPVNLDGSLGPRAQATRAFGRALQEAMQRPLLYWDERHSTSAALRLLREAELSRARRAAAVDRMAAAYILQGALDAMRFAATRSAPD